jgi:hypothetical protein
MEAVLGSDMAKRRPNAHRHAYTYLNLKLFMTVLFTRVLL